MVRAPCCDKMGLKKGPWTPEEDQLLISHVQQNGHANWRALPKQAGNCVPIAILFLKKIINVRRTLIYGYRSLSLVFE